MSGAWYHTWSKSRCKDTEIPIDPHYAVIVFKDHSYTEPGYDNDDPPTRGSVRTCDYYAFTNDVQMQKMVSDVYQEKSLRAPQFNDTRENVVAFFSSGRAKVNVSVNISVGEHK